MEFPHLGSHCAETTCKQLDFLPIKCDACSRIFCNDHVRYDNHRCTESYKKDNQVPVCPLCNKPIPLLPNENADIKVGHHIDTDCQSDPAKERRGKVYTNRCGVKGCKKKELIPMKCEKCRENFCIRHRHETDHQCTGFQASGRGMSAMGAAATSRQQSASRTSGQSRNPQQTLLQACGKSLNDARQSRAQSGGPWTHQNGEMSDEELARALQAQEDSDLARALEASERETRHQQQRQQANRRSSSDKSICGVS